MVAFKNADILRPVVHDISCVRKLPKVIERQLKNVSSRVDTTAQQRHQGKGQKYEEDLSTFE